MPGASGVAVPARSWVKVQLSTKSLSTAPVPRVNDPLGAVKNSPGPPEVPLFPRVASQALSQLADQGAAIVERSSEVFAALDALRALLSEAKSGDLARDGRTVSPQSVEALEDPDRRRKQHLRPTPARGMRERRVKAVVIGDEVFMVAGEAAELIQRLKRVAARVCDGLRDARGFEGKAKPQQVAGVGERDRIDAITLARLHRDEMFALQPQQGLAHRLAADRIAFGELLFAHIIARRQTTIQNIRPQAFVDIIP